jgi:S-adenosylmethionine decarboxylase proenzyme
VQIKDKDAAKMSKKASQTRNVPPNSASGRFEVPLDRSNRPYAVDLPIGFLLSALLCVGVVAFTIGRLSASFAVLSMSWGIVGTEGDHRALPPPLYSSQKKIPLTVYSSKHYDSGSISTSDTLLARRAHFGESFPPESFKAVEMDGTMMASENKTEELHEPSGHHLLVDIKSVNGKFLNSEEKLAQAMIDLVELSGLTMLSYHCHRLQPVGVSCVGVLLESHISIHTWPIPGAICMDLFTCGPNSLLPILPAIERFFGVPRIPAVHGSIVEKPFVQWAYKLRGFRSEQPSRSAGDIAQFLHGWLEFDMKELVVSVDTPFQKIDIYDVINPRFHSLHEYKSSLVKDESYAALHPQLFRPDRVLYLDGILQSRFYGEAAYHEALVHPAMFTHLNPKRVAIIGGGEGATLREVLKHNTVEAVTVIEIDELMVNVSIQYLPEWSDCSMFIGSEPSCFDDPRAEIHYTDAVVWFVDRFKESEKVNPQDKYDIIIMDALYVVLSLSVFNLAICSSRARWSVPFQ